MPLGIFTRGAKNKARQDAYNSAKRVYKEQKKEKKRQWRYDVEGLKIKKQNLYNELDFQDASRLQEYDYLQAREAFSYAQDMKAYNRSVELAFRMTDYADMAEQQANLQQDRYKFENEIALDLEEEQTALNYRYAAAGLSLDKRRAKAAATSDLRKSGLQSLKARGEAAARGQAGRSAYQNQQAVIAETAAIENEIVNNLFNANLAIDTDLTQLSDQLIMDKVSLDFSRNSLAFNDKMQRLAFKGQKLQAYINAAATIRDKPEMGPPIPKPLALPRPEFQDVYKPDFDLGKPKISDFGRKIGFGEALAGDLFKVGGAVLAGVTAGAGAIGAAGTATAAGTGYATKIGIGAGLSSFFNSY